MIQALTRISRILKHEEHEAHEEKEGGDTSAVRHHSVSPSFVSFVFFVVS
jgi:hypothetical protein